MYNVPPKDVSAYNHLAFEKGLSVGQAIKIPLTAMNFSQGNPAGKEEALIPVYHLVQPKEGLYRISLIFDKVPLDLLRKWNNLQGDVVSNGTRLVIGYLKVVKEQSPLALKAIHGENPHVTTKVKEEKKEMPKPDLPKEKVITQVPPVKDKIPVDTKTTESDNNNDPAAKTTTDRPVVNFSGGYFKNLYNNQTDKKSLVKENGTAGVFKTTSGWTDGKYYCFHNDAIPGTIIKITNSLSGKSVYAKVLDAVPDLKQNNGILLRLSNSAAEELGAGETKFDCSISYSK